MAQGPPRPAPALFIPKPPEMARGVPESNVQQATHIPDRPQTTPPQADPMKPVMMEHPLRVLYQRAAEQHNKMDSYIYRLKRREVVNGKRQPEEVMRVQLRKQPLSVHLVWLNEANKGREVIWVQGRYDNKLQVRLAANDPFALLGRHHSIAIDDPMVKSNSRHPATESGLGALIDRFGQMIVLSEKDPRHGTVKYLGRIERPEFKEKLEAAHQTIPPGSDPLLPKGGQRWMFFDTTNGLPALIITHDPTGEVEYYCYDNVIWPAPMDDRDFDPKVLWRK